MSETILNDLLVLLPEITIICTVIFTLVFGSYCQRIRSNTSWLLLLCFSAAAFIEFSLFAVNIKAFGNTILCNQYTASIKMLIMLSLAITLIVLQLVKKISDAMKFEVPILLSLSSVGMMIMIAANDLLVIYLGLELMSLTLYILVAYNSPANGQSSEAGIKFFMLGALSSCLYLFGSSMMYGFVGSMCFDAVGEYYISIMSGDSIEIAVPIVFLVALVLILSAFLFKVSAAPFHMWTPDVYQGASTFVTMILATMPKIASISVLLSTLYMPFVDLIDQWRQVIVFCSIISLVVGSLGGLMQKNLKRLLGYSTIGHIGFILMAMSVGEISGISSAISYVVIYIMMNFLTFIPLLALERGGNYNGTIRALCGLSKSHPFVGFMLLVAMLSMAGIPPFAGFFAKFYVLFSVIEQEMYALAIAGVITTVISCYYYLRVIKVIYFDAQEEKLIIEMPMMIKCLIIIICIFNIGYVVMPDILSNIAKLASEALISV